MAPAPARGRDHLGEALRTMVAVTLVFVAYYKAPLNRGLTFTSAMLFVGALVLGALVIVVEVRGILGSPIPIVKAVRVLALGLPILLVLFASTYVTIAGQQADAFTEPLNRTDGIYFTMTTFATVGYGDIAPVTQLARIVVTIQMVVGLIAVGVIAKAILGAARLARERNTAAEHAAEH